jgi:hypothetical protein
MESDQIATIEKANYAKVMLLLAEVLKKLENMNAETQKATKVKYT